MLDAESAGAVIAASIAGDETDKDYFTERAEAELELAQASMDPNVTRAHYELAGRYLDLVHNQATFLEWKQRRREPRWIPGDPGEVRTATPARLLFCES
jgi:hypothetical protein